MGGLNFGAFAGGLSKGIESGQEMVLAKNRDARAQQDFELNKTIRQQDFELNKTIKQIGIGRLQKEQSVLDKELQLRGTQADYNMNELNFDNTMQEFQQNTRRLLAQGNRIQAETGVTTANTAAGAATAATEQQPDQLKLAHDELKGKIADSVQRQTANIWNTLKLGNEDLAIKMFNDSKLLAPGEKVKSFKLDTVDGAPGPDGKPTKVQVLTGIPDGGGKPIQIPVSSLEQLSNKYGARYEKMADGTLLRLDSQGRPTIIHETGKYKSTSEGQIFNERTGAILASGGINPGGPSRKEAAAADARTAHVDARVKQLDSEIRFYLTGSNTMASMMPETQAQYDKLMAIGGALIRNGTAPEAARAQAIDQLNRAQALAETGGAAGGKSGATVYTGPTPWK